MALRIDEEVHANIAWSINCILNLSKFFCAAPLINVHLRSCVRKPLLQLAERTTIFRLLPRIAHILWTIAYAGILAIGMLYVLSGSTRIIIQVEKFIFVARFLCNTLTLWICFIGCQRQSSSYQLFFDEVTSVGRRLARFDIDLSRSANLLLHLRIKIGILFGYLLVIVLIDLITNEWNVADVFWSLMAHVVPSLTATCVMLQFATAMCVLEQLFGHIVDLVERVLAGQDAVQELAGRRGGHLSLTPLLGLAARSRSKWQEDIPTQQASILGSLRREHVELMAICDRLADSFGLAIIGVVVGGILDLTVNLFVFYKSAVNLDDGGKVYALAWMVMIGGRIFAVMWGCERVNRVRREIAPAMFQVEINGALITADLDRLIEQFSLQLLHDDCDRQMAAGLMPLNMRLLSTVFGVLTVYMVILIQFDASDRKTD